MVVWLLVELKPNCQHHGMALPMLGAVSGCHGDPPKCPTLGYISHFRLGSQKCNRAKFELAYFFKNEQPLSESRTRCGLNRYEEVSRDPILVVEKGAIHDPPRCTQKCNGLHNFEPTSHLSNQWGGREMGRHFLTDGGVGRWEDTTHTRRGYPSGGSVGRSTETSATRSAPSWRRGDVRSPFGL